MNSSDLRERLSVILAQEEQSMVDWAAVDQMLDRLSSDLKESGASECPHFVWHFIADSDIRAKDPVYGDYQRQEVRRFVDTGEYEESEEASPLGCWLVAGLPGALAFWLS